jgi:hypothetical protein
VRIDDLITAVGAPTTKSDPEACCRGSQSCAQALSSTFPFCWRALSIRARIWLNNPLRIGNTRLCPARAHLLRGGAQRLAFSLSITSRRGVGRFLTRETAGPGPPDTAERFAEARQARGRLDLIRHRSPRPPRRTAPPTVIRACLVVEAHTPRCAARRQCTMLLARTTAISLRRPFRALVPWPRGSQSAMAALSVFPRQLASAVQVGS